MSSTTLEPVLSGQFLQQLQQALAQGAYEPVRVYLKSRPAGELDARPQSRLLLAQANFDAGDFAAALGDLERLQQSLNGGVAGFSDILSAAAAMLQARVHAAMGDGRDADLALEQAESIVSGSQDLLRTALLVHLTLCRWEAVESILANRTAGVTDNFAAATLARNLLAMRTSQPDWAEELAAQRPWDTMFYVEIDGTWTPILRTGNDPQPLFDPTAQNQREALALTRCERSLSIMEPVLLLGVGTGRVVQELARVVPKQGKRLAMILVEPSRQWLAAILMSHDWSNLFHDRLIHLLGSSPRDLENFLRADYRRIPSRWDFAVCENADADFCVTYRTQLRERLERIQSELQHELTEVASYYEQPGFAERWRRRADGEPLKIMLQSCRYTTFIHNNVCHLAQALTGAGHEVVLLEEGDSQHHWVTGPYVQQQVIEHRPDLLVRMNFLRQEQPVPLPAGMPYLTWVQDYCPAHVDGCRPEYMLPRDYIVGISKQAMVRHGFPADHYLPATVPSLASIYTAEPKADRDYRYDISFVSHHSTMPKRWLDNLRLRRPTQEQWQFARTLFDHLQEIYSSKVSIREMLEESGPKYLDRIYGSTEKRPAWAYDYLLQLGNLIFRQQILQWIADAGYELALFGNGWEGHETLGRFARGPIGSGEPLRNVYRQSRISLQIMTTGNLHQRLIDGYLAGGFFLMPDTDPDVFALSRQDPHLYERILQRLSQDAVTTLDELRASDPELAEYMERVAEQSRVPIGERYRTRADAAFAAAEWELLSRTQVRLPIPQNVIFNDRNQLLEHLAYWLERDDQRQQSVTALQNSQALRSFTTEFQVERILNWLSRRIGTFDPPISQLGN